MTQQASQPDKGWETRYMIGFFGTMILVLGVVIAAFQRSIPPIAIWLALMALLIAMTLFLSRAYTHRWLGVIIDDRRKFSLSRLQMVMWTVIVLSSFVTAVLANVQLNLIVYVSGAVQPSQVIYMPVGSIMTDALLAVDVLKETDTGYTAVDGVDLSQLRLADALKDGEQIYVPLAGDTSQASQTLIAQSDASQESNTPLSVAIPTEVWLLLGISTTSLVASPLIKGQKKKKIQTNDSSSEAKLSDLFKGEEDSNYTTLDLAKVQMFYFTLIVIGAYMIAVANLFLSSQNAITSLPTLDSGVVAMLGVSHAGYLTNKAIPRPDGDSSGSDGTGNGDGTNQDATTQSGDAGDGGKG